MRFFVLVNSLVTFQCLVPRQNEIVGYERTKSAEINKFMKWCCWNNWTWGTAVAYSWSSATYSDARRPTSPGCVFAFVCRSELILVKVASVTAVDDWGQNIFQRTLYRRLLSLCRPLVLFLLVTVAQSSIKCCHYTPFGSIISAENTRTPTHTLATDKSRLDVADGSILRAVQSNSNTWVRTGEKK